MISIRSNAARLTAAVLSLCALLLGAATAHAQDAARIVHLLDYIAVDYEGAIANGQVKSPEEYAEMQEFATNVIEGIGKLPETPERPRLVAAAEGIRKLVADKVEPPRVADAAIALRKEVVTVYRVAVGPRRAPDLAIAIPLYAAHCASCHGATGLGDGPLAKGMDPAPANFHELERMRVRSVYGLYNTLTLGVAGTPMRAFPELSENERWSLAYLTASWGAKQEDIARGKALWEAGKLKSQFGNQASIAGRTESEAVQAAGADAGAVLAYLRTAPGLVEQGKPDPARVARDRLAESLELYRKGDSDGATQAALSSYLDGFELTEAAVRLVDEDLVRKIEGAMIDYRNAIKEKVPPAKLEAMQRELDGMLSDAQDRVSGGGLSEGASFLASFVILLREGLEAVLVVVALAAFLRRSGQAHAMPYLHAGWIAALLLGAVTWYVATRLIAASGASRELTEGISALVASAMLLYVGFWLHDKSHAQAWQGYLMAGAKRIGSGAAWGLAFMAFLAVYREVFETVLFYETLWAQAPGNGTAIGAGFVAALAVLVVLTWAILRYSVRLPLGLFFGVSGIVLAILAVVLAGNGIAALQEAGLIPVTRVPFITLRWLGVYPNAQGLGVQAALIVLIAVLLLRARKR